MNSLKNSSSSDSGGAVATAPPPPEKSSSELIYVEEQAANAKAALKQTLSEIKQGLGQGVSIRQWTAAHPWMMMSSAAVAGFVAGCAAIPGKDETLRGKLEELTAVLRKEKSDNGDASDHGKNGHSGHKSFLTSIMGDVLKAVIPAAGTIISAAMQQPAAPGETNSAGSATGNSMGS